jgi:hypothetical protein
VEWTTWKFKVVPKHFWDDIANRKAFLKYAEDKLNIKKPEDWYNSSARDVKDLGGQGFLLYLKGEYVGHIMRDCIGDSIATL